jgi:hypothetical protein
VILPAGPAAARPAGRITVERRRRRRMERQTGVQPAGCLS